MRALGGDPALSPCFQKGESCAKIKETKMKKMTIVLISIMLVLFVSIAHAIEIDKNSIESQDDFLLISITKLPNDDVVLIGTVISEMPIDGKVVPGIGTFVTIFPSDIPLLFSCENFPCLIITTDLDKFKFTNGTSTLINGDLR